MKLNKVKLISEICGIWVTVIGILSAGIFALIEYENHKKSELLKSTMTMYNKFNNEVYYTARKKIALSENNSIDELNKLLNNSDKDTVAVSYMNFIHARVEKDVLSKELDDILLILEDVAICVRANVCDYDSAIAFFFDYGRDFFRTYYPYICKERENWSNQSIGMMLEKFYNPSSKKNVCNIS